jgi:hypothetical protein
MRQEGLGIDRIYFKERRKEGKAWVENDFEKRIENPEPERVNKLLRA